MNGATAGSDAALLGALAAKWGSPFPTSLEAGHQAPLLGLAQVSVPWICRVGSDIQAVLGPPPQLTAPWPSLTPLPCPSSPHRPSHVHNDPLPWYGADWLHSAAYQPCARPHPTPARVGGGRWTCNQPRPQGRMLQAVALGLQHSVLLHSLIHAAEERPRSPFSKGLLASGDPRAWPGKLMA